MAISYLNKKYIIIQKRLIALLVAHSVMIEKLPHIAVGIGRLTGYRLPTNY